MFGSTTTNFQVMFMLYLIPLIIGITLLTKKKYLLGAFVLSLFANIIFYFDVNTLDYYGWFVVFVLNIWPILNLALLVAIVIKFFQKKYAK